MKRVVVSDKAIKAMIARNTKASAGLEGRDVPDNHTRSQAVRDYLDALALQGRSAAAHGVFRTQSAGAIPIAENEVEQGARN